MSENKFDGVFQSVKKLKQDAAAISEPSARTAKHLDIQTSEDQNIQLSKSKDPHYQRTTIYIPKLLHRKLKAVAAEDDREISDIVETLIQEWIESRNNI